RAWAEPRGFSKPAPPPVPQFSLVPYRRGDRLVSRCAQGKGARGLRTPLKPHLRSGRVHAQPCSPGADPVTPRGHTAAQRGFTLIELMLALSLLALLMMLLYQSFPAVAGSKLPGANRLAA